MGIELLGPLQVDGRDASLSPRDQVVLSALAVRAGEVVAADRLADALWGEVPPVSWPKVVQGCVLRLRRSLGTAAIETTSAGYRLTLGPDEVDSKQFERLVAKGRRLAESGEFDRAVVAYASALELWRGPPFGALDDWSAGRIEASRLEEMRRTTEEGVLDARLAIGDHRDVVGPAEARVAEEPLREHRWATLATALYRSGRQADALRALKNARRVLVDQLGVEPGSELVALESAILNQDTTLEAARHQPAFVDRCPYKGLVPYDADDTESFFGRGNDVGSCLERLRSHPLLVVTGPSGCGKSSLVRAGVVPALTRAGRSVVVFVPGADPDGAMTNALSSTGAAPVVVVDQFEEVFTLADDTSAASGFCARLAEYATTTAAVIVAVRADHVAALAADTEFARLAEQGLRITSPLAGAALREAIEEPARLAGLRLEHGLVDLLVRDTEGEPGALPLLSHALVETWQRRDGRVLTVDGYRATGEIRGAVARSADRLYESLPADQRPKLRSVMLRLVSPSADGEPVRSRVAIRTFGGDAERERVLALLVRARLVTTEQDSVELAHEALARAWPRLRSWLDEDAAGQRIFRHLAATADGWEALGRPVDELYRGSRLDAAIEWRDADAFDLTATEQAFLDASIDAAASERQQLAAQARHQAIQNRRLRRSLVAVGVLLVGALVAGVLAYQQRQDARREERDSAMTALTSTASALHATRRDLAALLAVEAYRMDPGPATQSALFGTFTSSPGLVRTLHPDLPYGGFVGEYLPGTDRLALVDETGAVRLFDLGTGDAIVLDPLAEARGATTLTTSADGRYVAVSWRPDNLTLMADRYSMLTVWDLRTAERRFEPIRVPYATGSLSMSADGSAVVASGGYSGWTHVYDAATGALRVELDPLPRPEEAQNLGRTARTSFLPDGSLIVMSMAGPIRIVDSADGAELRRLDAAPFTGIDFMSVSPDGTTLTAIGGPADNGGATVVGIDLETGDQLWDYEILPYCNNWAVAHRKGTLLCGQFGGVVAEFDLDTGVQLDRSFDGRTGDVCALIVSPDGTRLSQISGCGAGSRAILEWRLDGGGAISRLVHDGRGARYATRYGFGGDPNVLLAEYADPGEDEITTHALDLENGAEIDRFPSTFGFWPTDDPDIVLVEVPDGDGSAFGRYDISRHEFVARPQRVDIDFGIWGIVVRGERVIAWGSADDGFHVTGIDIDTGRPAPPTLFSDLADGFDSFNVQGVAIGDDVFYTSTIDGDGFRIDRRDLETGEILAQSANGFRTIVLGGGMAFANTLDGHLWQVDADTLQTVGAEFPGVTGAVDELLLDDAARLLMVRNSDMTSILLYDVATRTLLGGPIDLDDPFPERSGVLRGDGLELAATVGQGLAVWDLDPAHWVEAACRLAGRNLTRSEWDQFIGDLATYRSTCVQFPAGA